MIIVGMEDFQETCRKKLVEKYNELCETKININQTFVVWSCKTLQNYKALLSTKVNGDGCYVEYTFNGDKQELYEDFYFKRTNTCYKE